MDDLRASLRSRDDEDLLLFQQQFLEEKQARGATPAAHVKRVAPPVVKPVERDVVSLDLPSMPALSSATTKSAGGRKSKFSQARALQASSGNKASPASKVIASQTAKFKLEDSNSNVVNELRKEDGATSQGVDDNVRDEGYFVDDDGEVYVEDEEDPYERMERSDTGISSVLSRIRERDTSNFTYQFPTFKSTPFPEVMHRSKFSAKKSNVKGDNLHTPAPSSGTNTNDIFGQIHQENEQKISAMSSSEISEAQRDILKSLDPSLISMLRNRKTAKNSRTNAQSSHSSAQAVTAAAPTTLPVTLPAAQPATQSPNQTTLAVPQPTTQKTLRFSSNLEPQPLKKLSAEEREEQRHKKQAIRNNQQQAQKLEMQEQFEQNNKSIIVLAEGPKVSESPAVFTPVPTDVASWRFDFDGNLVAKGSEMPTHLGLHHHSDEQNEAGYTLGEVHSLARSIFPGQKVLALKIVTLVSKNSRRGLYNTELLNYIFKLKFPRLLRTCLDDINPSVIVATVEALHALVVDEAWERYCVALSSRYRGHEGLPLHPISALSGKIGTKSKQDEEPELDDDELLTQDLVKGLLRTNLLNRLRYILEVVKLPSVVLPILELLTHMARHSIATANEIIECDRLVDFVIAEFIRIPCDLDSLDAAAPYNSPLVQAVRLVAVLCQSSRKSCEVIVASGLVVDATRFVEAVKRTRSVTVLELFKETMFLWRILSSYGLNLDCINRVSFLFELVQNWLPSASSDLAACMIVTSLYNLLEATTHASTASPSLGFDQIALFVNPALSLLGKVDLSSCVDVNFLQAMSSMIHFLGSYVQKLSKLFVNNPSNLYSIVEHFCSTVLLFILPQINLEAMLSVFSGEAQPIAWEYLFSLVRLVRICSHTHLTVGSVLRDCILPFSRGGVVELLWHTLLRCAKEEVEHTARALFQNRTLCHLQYVVLLLLDEPCLTTDFIPPPLHKGEQQTFKSLIQPDRSTIQLFIPSETPESVWYQIKNDIAMTLVQKFLPGEVVLLLDCLRKFVFHPTYLEAAQLDLQDIELTARTCLEFFETDLFSDREITISSNLILPIQENIHSLFLPLKEQVTQYSLPFNASYVLSPINFYYDQTYNVSLEYGIATPPTDGLVHYLQFWLLLEQSSSYLDSFVPRDSRYITLMKVFLLSEDLFLDPPVQQAIIGIFNSLTKESFLWNASVADPKFIGFLEDFISQFCAVSYGNIAFASVLFIFLRMEFPAIFRKIIWRELFEMLSLLENAQRFPMGVEGYCFPTEENMDVLALYANSLVNQKVTRKSASLYWIAVHHISSFLFGTSSASMKQELLYKLVMGAPKKTLDDIFSYKYESTSPLFCSEVMLSAKQIELLQNIHNIEITTTLRGYYPSQF